MSVLINHKKAFMALFNETARYRHRYRVFGDFVQCAAISLHNAFCPDSELEQQYLQIIKHYEPEEVTRLSQLLVHVMRVLEHEPHDFLGGIFMEMNLGNKHLKPFFTPWHISRVMANTEYRYRQTTSRYCRRYCPECAGRRWCDYPISARF